VAWWYPGYATAAAVEDYSFVTQNFAKNPKMNMIFTRKQD
jgi:hypothetical protein